MTETPPRWTDGRYQLPLYVTDGEIARRMGVGVKAGRKAIQQLRLHPKFPPRTFGGRRYWPSVVDFLDAWNGRASAVRTDPAAPPDEPLERLRALEQRLGRELDPELASDPELQRFLIDDDARRSNGGRRQPSMEKAEVWLANRRLEQTRSNDAGKSRLEPSPAVKPIVQKRKLAPPPPRRGRKADEYWDAYMKSPLNKRTFHKPGWVFILAPDGGNWIEEAKPTDPGSWQKDFVPPPTSPTEDEC
ncbi:MAG: hypothetical protein JWQ24_845 [Tardiphaga sp.]|nr:hypothetical protein [Tardiphaga sp.]